VELGNCKRQIGSIGHGHEKVMEDQARQAGRGESTHVSERVAEGLGLYSGAT
jgi:hypothetical protein